MGTGGISFRHRAAAEILRVDRRHAAAPQRVGKLRAGERSVVARVPRAARARQADAESPGVGTHRQRDAARGGARGARTSTCRQGAARPRRRNRFHPRKAPLDAVEEIAMKALGSPWMFVAPALVVIGVFFLLPVIAALALSFTDFDLYALANLKNLRLVAFDNYIEVLRTPLFWKSLINTLYFVVVGVPLSIAASLGAAMLLNSPLAKLKGI